VPYRDLISPFRAVAQTKFKRTFAEKLRRFLAAQTIPFPRRFRLAAATGRLGKLVRPLVPAALRPMIDLVPAHLPPAAIPSNRMNCVVTMIASSTAHTPEAVRKNSLSCER
jgi:glycolate oxidase iron-sulfur subunit